MLRVLPGHRDLLRALVQYDVVGFQTELDRENFIAGLRDGGVGGQRGDDGYITVLDRRILVDAFPISIDVAEVEEYSASSFEAHAVRRLAADIGGRQFIIGVDRLDYSKGLPERFRAYQKLLELHPATRRQVVFLQIASPTRIGVPEYEEIRHKLEQSVGHINGQFAGPVWTPIRYINRQFSRQVLMGYFRVASIGLVTPLRDGMNLVAKEFVAAQDPLDPGVLVLSRLAGAAVELADGALLVNPYDPLGMTEALLRATEMPLAERCERHAAMMQVMRANDIHAWHGRFIDALCA
jgi:trehalose 6-phosphate synthase